jgi:hypothetical protein
MKTMNFMQTSKLISSGCLMSLLVTQLASSAVAGSPPSVLEVRETPGPTGPVQALQQGPAYFSPGATLRITNTFIFTNRIWSLLWRPALPNGWALQTVSGPGQPEIFGGEILWTGAFGSSPIEMVYTVMVPSHIQDPAEIRAEVEYLVEGMMNPALIPAEPQPLVITAASTASLVTTLYWQHPDDSLAQWVLSQTNLFVSQFLKPDGFSGQWTVLSTADFNGDGHDDLLVQFADRSLGVWFMQDQNLVQFECLNSTNASPVQLPPNWRVLDAGDFNRDHHPDLLLQHNDGTLGLWILDGTTLIRSGLLNPSQAASGCQYCGLADFDGDGSSDLVLTRSDRTLAQSIGFGFGMGHGCFGRL